MKIRMRTVAAGPAGTLQPGQEYEVPKEFGEALVAGGYAEELAAKSKPAPKPAPKQKTKRETATNAAREKAVKE